MRPATEQLIFNPFDPEFRKDPYPVYDWLLAGDRVRVSPLGLWIFPRYEDCTAILRDKRFSADSRNAEGFVAPGSEEEARLFDENRPFLFLDPPDHRRLRGLVSKAFTPHAVEAMRPRIEEIVDDLLDAAREKGEVDLIADLAYPLPVTVISEMLGVPKEDSDRFRKWSDDLARSLDPDFAVTDTSARDEAASAFRDYFTDLVAKRRSDPGGDLLSSLIAAEEEGDRLNEAELLTTCILLLVAGHETTVNLIANGVLALLRNPDQCAFLASRLDLITTAVEEMLRYDPPVQFTGRIALEDVEIAGEVVPKGKVALTLLAAANRDPDQFDEPDHFDITRDPNPHLAFGMGIHHCLGAPLARLEGQVAIAGLVDRFPGMQLATEDVTYKENVVLRGLAELRVRL
ncbi:MAG: cytochrome P450 [Acidobacteria bacterium]|nr:MAG: cytochrome P450 [Acidobacteriota bacterium]